jgi:hypothetical protein
MNRLECLNRLQFEQDSPVRHEIGSERAYRNSIVHDGDRHFALVRDAALPEFNFERIRVNALNKTKPKSPMDGSKRADNLAR